MIKPISKKKYYETISEQIEQAILTGEWAEGSRVPTEDELASIFEVGRGSIREAITNLQMSGVLVSSPGIGTYVSDNAVACINNSQLADTLNDPESVNDIVKARKILEPLLAAYAANNATQKDIDKMQNAIDKARKSDPDSWKKNGHLFHIALGDACKNRIIISLYKSVEETSRKAAGADAPTAEFIEKQANACQAVLDAIVKKDAVLAEQRMSDLLK